MAPSNNEQAGNGRETFKLAPGSHDELRKLLDGRVPSGQTVRARSVWDDVFGFRHTKTNGARISGTGVDKDLRAMEITVDLDTDTITITPV